MATFEIFNQYDSRWAKHDLGSGRGELGPYGCFECVVTMVAGDAFPDMRTTPDRFDDLLYSRHEFSGDLLPNNALDRLRPDRFRTTQYNGWRADVVKAAVSAKDRYAWVHVSGWSPLWRMNCDHYVLMFSADGTKIADPAGGLVRLLSAYGGPANVRQTSSCQKLTPPPPAAPTPPVVVNQKPPVLPPVLIAVPDPLFTVKVTSSEAASFIAAPGPVMYDTAVAMARTYAQQHVGVLVEVIDEKGQTVDSEFVAPPPAAVSSSGPVAAVTPPPMHVLRPDFWAQLQSAIIRIILSLRR